MALHKYLRSVPSSDSSRQDSSLASKPHNVISLVSGEKETQKPRGSAYVYQIVSGKKAEIGKYASHNGVVNAVRHFKHMSLKESSVREWRDAYLREISLQKKNRQTW